MKIRKWLPLLILALASVAGCERDESGRPRGTGVEQAERQVRQAEQEFESTRHEYVNRIRQEKQDMSRQIDQWQARLDDPNVPEATKQRYRDTIQRLSKERDELQSELEDAAEAGQGEWQKTKTDLDNAWNRLQTSYRSARQQIGDALD